MNHSALSLVLQKVYGSDEAKINNVEMSHIKNNVYTKTINVTLYNNDKNLHIRMSEQQPASVLAQPIRNKTLTFLLLYIVLEYRWFPPRNPII